MTVDTFVKKALTNWVCLVWTILVERHGNITNIITRIIISIIVPDPILCVMLWSHLRGSSTDNWSASCSAKLSKLLEEGRLLEKVSRISFCNNCTRFSSVQFSRSVVSHSLQPHELQHSRPPCPSPTPAVHSDSCPLSRWCHPAISSFVIPFSSCPQSLPGSGSFLMGQLLEWGCQSIGVSALASVLPLNTQDWSPLGWTGWILQSKGLSRVFFNTTVQKHQFFGTQLSSSPTLTSIHDHW